MECQDEEVANSSRRQVPEQQADRSRDRTQMWAQAMSRALRIRAAAGQPFLVLS